MHGAEQTLGSSIKGAKERKRNAKVKKASVGRWRTSSTWPIVLSCCSVLKLKSPIFKSLLQRLRLKAP